jgi:ubiquinone/menaquinone biosynthesis C-methylase UbiE
MLGLCQRCETREVRSSPVECYDRRYQEVTLHYIRPAEVPRFKRIVQRTGAGMILDDGCGRGALLAGLKNRDRSLHGVDISETGIRMARNFCQNANLLVADIKKLPFKSNTFDFVVCSDAIEHIEGAQHVQESYRVLKPKGSFLVTVPNGKGRKGSYPGHIRLFTLKSITDFLQEAGFEIISADKFGLYIPIISYALELLSLAIRKNLPFAGPLNVRVPELLATNFFIECRKAPCK